MSTGCKMKTFILMSTHSYDSMIQRQKQIIKRLSKENIVYYYEIKSEKCFLKKDKNFFVLDNNYINKIKYLQSTGSVIIWCSSIYEAKFVDKIPHDFVIFDFDFHLSTWSGSEQEIYKSGDIIFTSSQKSYESLEPTHPKVFLVKNGVDLDSFSVYKNDIPEDMPLGKNVVGYVGEIGEGIDWELVKFIVKNKDLNFVFIGDYDKSLLDEISGDNVFFLGEKKYEDLPFYINNFNCAILPIDANIEIDNFNYFEFYEYMALGIPVVSTEVLKLGEYSKVCYTCAAKEQFANYIDIAVNESDTSLRLLRRRIASQNSWDKRIDEIDNIVNRELKLE